ncbi:MAG: dephospho-CoA kinase [Candidatus Latescibacteria bacterium]|nr:dephospho-CoA kinase [Candidatus Latescibacterota bacterium]NIM20953.1 dephospho-CoA kinase [Candidatus Latescibacterota bacterium]NIM65088.1 dephospho-CoA kinase [Candidatus Latescibacterota bacterium]NIO01603.1 dephospho-CoA kinase [Candidatus Latescibacterota bacterium]NIO28120.1 dephospho-CoA kinase [Candidatus Latescibacterota bacterium]
MKIIGLAGESGTGKSSIAEHLKSRGGGHIDADRLGHELLETDAAVRAKILRYFGPDVFTSEGSVDRKKLGEMVFRDGELLKVLNRILHPRIIEACLKRLDQLQQDGFEFVVIDAALLLEVDLPFHMDVAIALRCDKEEQIRRLRAKGGATEEEIRLRLKSQVDLESSFHNADIIIDTDGELSQVLAEVDAIVDDVLDRNT